MSAAVMILIVKNGSGRRQTAPTTAPIVPTAAPEEEQTLPDAEGDTQTPSEADAASELPSAVTSSASEDGTEENDAAGQSSPQIVIEIGDTGGNLPGQTSPEENGSGDTSAAYEAGSDASVSPDQADIIAEITLPQN